MSPQEWIKPIADKYWDEFPNNGSRCKIHIINGNNCCAGGEYLIGIPKELVIGSMEDRDNFPLFYSGKNLKLSYDVTLAYSLYHEMAHHFVDTGDKGLDEAIVDDTACRRFFSYDEGKKLAFLVVARKLVEANLFGIRDYHDISEIILPYDFNPVFLSSLQEELDSYHLKPELAWKVLEHRKKKWDKKFSDYYPNYSKGFVKWLDLNNNVN